MLPKSKITEYINGKISFYNNLEKIYDESLEIVNSITINSKFLNLIETEFKDYLHIRDKTNKISFKENEKFKTDLINKFEELKLLKTNSNKPTIYWFEISTKSNFDNRKILKKFLTSKKVGAGWWTVGNINRDFDTDLLYLGKVEKNLFGRFLQHLGIGHKKTSSLKLRKWFKEFDNVDLQFRYIQFEDSVLPYLEDFENIYWRHYQPLLGQEPRIK